VREILRVLEEILKDGSVKACFARRFRPSPPSKTLCLQGFCGGSRGEFHRILHLFGSTASARAPSVQRSPTARLPWQCQPFHTRNHV
jgi:hypothetical protein